MVIEEYGLPAVSSPGWTIVRRFLSGAGDPSVRQSVCIFDSATPDVFAPSSAAISQEMRALEMAVDAALGRESVVVLRSGRKGGFDELIRMYVQVAPSKEFDKSSDIVDGVHLLGLQAIVVGAEEVVLVFPDGASLFRIHPG